MRRTNLHTEDFIEMLKRGDSVIDVAFYGGISVASLERRFQRFPKEIRDEIRKCRSGRVLDWWCGKVRESSTYIERNRERNRAYYRRRHG